MLRSWSMALLLALSALAAAAQPQTAATQPQSAVALPQGMARVTSVEGITEYRLANGLQVLLVPDDSKPTTTVNLTYRVGSRHENYGETGMAHLLEHLMFKGTPTTRTVWAEMHKRGLRANGTHLVRPHQLLRQFLGQRRQPALVPGLAGRFDGQQLHREEGPRQRDDRGAQRAGERREQPRRVLSAARPGTITSGTTTARAPSARAAMSRASTSRACRRSTATYYQPDNATLIVSGRFDPRACWPRWRGTSAHPEAAARAAAVLYTLEPVQDGERQVTLRRVGGTPSIYMAYHMPPGAAPDFAAVEMIASVLGDTPGGRLHKRLVEKQLAAHAFGFAWDLAEPGLLLQVPAWRRGRTWPRRALRWRRPSTRWPASPSPPRNWSAPARSGSIGWDEGFADPERVGVALSESIGMGDWRLFFLRRDQVRNVTLADVQRVATTWLRPDNRTVGPVPADGVARSRTGAGPGGRGGTW